MIEIVVDRIVSVLIEVVCFPLGQLVAYILFPGLKFESFKESQAPKDSKWYALTYMKEGKKYLLSGPTSFLGFMIILLVVIAVVLVAKHDW